MGTPFAHKDRSGQADWPKGVDEITADDLVRMGVDKHGRLHWDGKPVSIVSVRRFSLTFFQGVVAVAAIVGGLGGAAQGWSAGHEYGCKTGWIASGCDGLLKK
jgi:hypothetical protein